MLVADTRLGHRDDPAVAARLEGADHARVVLSDTDRRRSRVRTETAGGRDLGIVVPAALEDGDVLEAGDGTLVVVELDTVDALVFDFAGAGVAPTAALELGHALGNRHWDLAVRGTEALVPVAGSRSRMEDAVDGVLPDGVTVRSEPVPPTTFDDGREDAHAGADHSHRGGHAHSHGHGDTHSHGHDHGVGTVDRGGEE